MLGGLYNKISMGTDTDNKSHKSHTVNLTGTGAESSIFDVIIDLIIKLKKKK